MENESLKRKKTEHAEPTSQVQTRQRTLSQLSAASNKAVE